MISSPSQEDDTSNSEMLVESELFSHTSSEEEPRPASYPLFGVGQSRMSSAHSVPLQISLAGTQQDWLILGRRSGHRKRWTPKKDMLSSMSNVSTDTAMKKRKLSRTPNDENAFDTMSLSSSASTSSRRKLGNNCKKPARIITVDDNSCQLPLTLQQILNEEKASITLPGFDDSQCGTPRPVRRLHVLPATVSVHQVLEHFVNRAMDDKEGVVRRHFSHTLEDVFHKVLVQDLLYAEEVPQYHALLFSNESVQQRQQQPPSHIYGCSFLLRFLVRLPQYTTFSKSEFSAFAASIERMSLVGDLVMLLQRNRQVCFRHDAYRAPLYEELLEWEQELIKDNTRWIVQKKDNDNVTNGDDSMVVTTPTKQNSAYSSH